MLRTTYAYLLLLLGFVVCYHMASQVLLYKKKKKERESLDLDIYTQCSDSKAANLANSCQKLTRNLFTAYKHSSTGDSPYDLGESCNLYVWGSSDVNYRDVLNIMNERHNGIVQQYQTNYFILPEFICFI